VIDGEALDAEVPDLKIGRSAVALFQEDIERFRTMMKDIGSQQASDVGVEDALHLGELEQLDDVQWERVVKEFFRR